MIAEPIAEPQEWLTGPEAARHLGISVTTLYKYIHLGHVRRYRPARSRVVRFKRSELDIFMESQARHGVW